MKKILFLAIAVMVIAACSNDNGRGLTESIGSIAIKLQDTTNFNYFLPGTGTFEFQQISERSKQANNIKTSVRIKDDSGGEGTVDFEIFLFKDSNFTKAHLDFVASTQVSKQVDSFSPLFSNGSIKISNNNFQLAQFSNAENSISGKYTGTARVFTITESSETDEDVGEPIEDGSDDSTAEDDEGDGEDDGTGDDSSGEEEEDGDSTSEEGEDDSEEENTGDNTDENDSSEDEAEGQEDSEEGQNTEEETLEIFNVIGNIDRNNTLFLLSTKDNTEFATLSGALLNSSSPIFAGEFRKGSTSQEITGTFDDSGQNLILLQIEFMTGADTRNLAIELTKNQ